MRDGPEQHGATRTRSTRGLGILWIPVLLLFVVHIGSFIKTADQLFDGDLLGTDSYSRLVQADELHRSGEWFQELLPRSNAPFGERRTWTRPFDAVLLAGALPLSLLVDFKTALHAWGLVVSPLLHLATMLAFLWAMRPVLDAQGQFYAALMLLVQASIVAQFLPGKPDHHSFQALLFVLLLGSVLRMIAERISNLAPILAAIFAGLAIWTSVEGLVFVALTLLVLLLLWIVEVGQTARSALLYATSAVVVVALAIAIERPPDQWHVAEYDRISIVHLYLFTLTAAFWLALWSMPSGSALAATKSTRLLSALVAGAIALGLIWWAYPAVFTGPMVGVPSRVVEIWNTQVAEYQLAIDPERPFETLYILLLFLGPVLPAVVYLPFLVARRGGQERRLWSFFLVVLAIMLALSLYQLRWGIYAQILALPVYAELLRATLRTFKLERQARPTFVATLGRVLVIFVFAGIFILLGRVSMPEATAGPGGSVRGNDGAGVDCKLSGLGRMLTAGDLGQRQRNILAPIFWGPELLYRTPHKFVATPNHRNAAGILDTIDFFSSTDLDRARDIATRRRIDLVLLCPGEPETSLYQIGDALTLYDRLVAGSPPAWLRPAASEDEVPEGVLMFRVN